MFEAHQDTVPTDNMTIEPFTPRVENGRLYGRGSCDIKGGMASMLAAFARLAREKPRGAANVVMACTIDEEYTFTGVTHLVKLPLKVDMAVVAEPTDLNIVNAHKGGAGWHLVTPGKACHSSAPDKGINAIYRMGRLLVAVERYAKELQASRNDPVLGRPTVSVGIIQGGTSHNTVPDRCRIEIDRRIVPGEDPKTVADHLEAWLKSQPDVDFPFETIKPWKAKGPLSPKGSEELTALLGQAINAVVGSHKVMGVPYGTDASTIAEAGIPSVVFGPGDIGKAHTCDESVPTAEVEQAAEVLYRFACGQ
jgi:acetylornithine deacetylase